MALNTRSRRFGWHSGQVRALNIQSGTVDITTNGSGDGSTAVTFNHTFKNTPSVTLTAAEYVTTGVLAVSTGDNRGFTAQVEGSSVTGGTLTANWTAIDQTK